MLTFNTHPNELFVEHILCKDVAIFWQKSWWESAVPECFQGEERQKIIIIITVNFYRFTTLF